MAKKKNETDTLLALNGERYFVDDEGDYEVLFTATRVAKTPSRPQGIKSLSCFWTPKAIVSFVFDNAHAATTGSGPGKKTSSGRRSTSAFSGSALDRKGGLI